MQKSERLVALDAVRFVAMFLMIQGHTLDALVAPTELDVTKFPWSVWNFLRGLTAPVFLLASGIIHVFATKRDSHGRLPRQLVWRRIRWALTLLGIGYLMMFPAQRLWHLNYVPAEQWTAFFRVHILQLLGVTLLAVLALFLLTRTHRQLALAGAIVGLLIVLAAPAAAWVDWYRVLPEPLAAYMSTDRGSLFPVIPFSAYLFLGLPLGAWLLQLPSGTRLWALQRIVPLAGLGLTAASVALAPCFQGLLPPHANPFHANPGFILLRFGLALVFVGAIAWLYGWTRNWANLYTLAGRYALFVFVGHLVVLYGTPWFDSFARWYPKTLSLAEGIGILAVVLALLGVGIAAAELLRRWWRKPSLLWAGVGSVLGYILLAP